MQHESQTDTAEFNGKRILVTGGTRGIGEAVVERLIRGGGRVITTGRSLPPNGTPDRFVQADVRVVHAFVRGVTHEGTLSGIGWQPCTAQGKLLKLRR